MQATRVRFVDGPTVARLEQAINAALAELEDDPAVEAIERITYRPSGTGDSAAFSAMIVYRLAPPAPMAVEAVAEAEAIIQDEGVNGI